MNTIADIKTRFANMSDLDLLHEFKNIDRAAEKFDLANLPETIWDEWNLAEAELLARMAK